MNGARSLPASWTSFVGHERALGELLELVGARRLVTLIGVGGAGKSRLALEVARRVEDRHRDGVRMVELAGLRDGSLLPEAVLAGAGLRDPPAGRSVTDFLCASLAHRDVVLLLDNCEHVVASVAELACALLAACPDVSILATSREPLCVPGEVERPAPLLDRPDSETSEAPDRLHEYAAVRLLVERAADVRPDFSLTGDNAAAVARISAALDGIPLAIELVAARFRTLAPEQVAERLDAQMELLGPAGRGRPDRQHTMRATLDWSHDLLASDERTVFRRLSIFAGGFRLDAAVDVAGENVASAGEVIESLVGKSLVEIDPDRAEPRLRMLEPVRQHAAEKLSEAHEQDALADRHLDWTLRFAAQAGRSFMTEQRVWGVRLQKEQHNIRQALELALDRGNGASALRIVAALGYPWFTMGQPDALKWVTRALDSGGDVPPTIRALALQHAGMLAESALDYEQSVRHLREALEVSRQMGVRRLEPWILSALGRAANFLDVDGRPTVAWFEDALSIFRELGDVSGIGWTLAHLAEMSIRAGHLEKALQQALESLEIGDRTGILGIRGESRRVLGWIAAERGDFDQAEGILDEAARDYEAAGDRWQLTAILATKVSFILDRGDLARALVTARAALRLARDAAVGWRLLHAIVVAARALFLRGRPSVAAELVGAVESARVRLPEFLLNGRLGLNEFAAVEIDRYTDGRRAGKHLSTEQATELALRLLDEEIASTAPDEAGLPEFARIRAAGDAEHAHEIFRRDGDLWTIRYAGKEIRLRDLRGLHYLATLLREPGREFHATDLVRSGHGPSFAPPIDDTLAVAHGTGDAGERLDARARAAYRARIDALDDAIAEAERLNDRGRLEHARDERETLLAELGAAARGKRASSDAERARLTATKGIKAALDKIAASHPELGAHLHATVRRGYFCAYVPDPRHPIEWET